MSPRSPDKDPVENLKSTDNAEPQKEGEETSNCWDVVEDGVPQGSSVL